jgi:pSer/pThr/pTyr-binding forkhead associated (FHA) protein
VLHIACRLLGNHAPVAYVRDQLDVDPTGLDAARADLEQVRRRCYAERMRADAIDRAVARAAGELRAEWHQPAGDAAGDGAKPRSSRGFRLAIRKDGEAAVVEKQFNAAPVTIGRRAEDNVLMLGDPMVSSLHAIVEATADGYAIQDRGSTNGTEVDGIRLPTEVLQPLVDGSVIYIRPYRLTLRMASPARPGTRRPLAGEALVEAVRAAAAEAPDTDTATAAVVAVSRRLAALHGEDELLLRLGELAPARGDSGFVAAAATAVLRQIAHTPLDDAESPANFDAEQFAWKLARCVEVGSSFCELTFELRMALTAHLGLDSAGANQAIGVRNATDVRRLILGSSSPGADAVAFLSRFHDELLAIQAGLLANHERLRAALSERLDPARLVESIGRSVRLPLLVQATAGSALWKAYVQAHAEVSAACPSEAGLLAEVQRTLAAWRERRG